MLNSQKEEGLASTTLTVACCTRDRPRELARLTASLIAALAAAPDIGAEFLVIDDGALDAEFQADLVKRLGAVGVSCRFVNKQASPGLLLSRIRAVELAAHEWILFVDDDVEIAPDYLMRLGADIALQPELSGIGGIDILAARRNFWKLCLCQLLGLEPLRRGRLSFAGFPSNLGRLSDASRALPSDRLYGCNMAFRRRAIAELRMLPGFQGYSLGEDAYLSFVAMGSGALLIDPALKVQHHHSPSARDADFNVGRMSIHNHSLLMRLYGRPHWLLASLLVSFPAMIVLSVVKAFAVLIRQGDRGGLAFARGQVSAMTSVLSGRQRKVQLASGLVRTGYPRQGR